MSPEGQPPHDGRNHQQTNLGDEAGKVIVEPEHAGQSKGHHEHWNHTKSHREPSGLVLLGGAHALRALTHPEVVSGVPPEVFNSAHRDAFYPAASELTRQPAAVRLAMSLTVSPASPQPYWTWWGARQLAMTRHVGCAQQQGRCMPSTAVKDALAICCEYLGAPATVELVARAGARAVDACELNAAVITSVPYEQWRGLGASHLWQFVWFELASARPQLFPGYRPDEDTASELALRYELGRGDTLTPLSLRSTEEAQLSEARTALVSWTGLEGLHRREPLVVGVRCRALFRAMAGAQALHAPDLREYVLVHEEMVTFCRQCASEVSDLSLVLLHT